MKVFNKRTIFIKFDHPALNTWKQNPVQVQMPGSVAIRTLLVDEAPVITFAFLFRSKCSCCLRREDFNGEAISVSMNHSLHRQAEIAKKSHLLFKAVKQMPVRMYREHKQEQPQAGKCQWRFQKNLTLPGDGTSAPSRSRPFQGTQVESPDCQAAHQSSLGSRSCWELSAGSAAGTRALLRV